MKEVGVVALNETEFLTPGLKEKVGGEYYTLYFYNKDEETHLCEIRPSFYLTPFDYASKRLLSDEDDSEFRVDLMGDPIYMHCHAIEALDPKFKTVVEIPMDDDEDFDDQAREELSANPVHPEYMQTM